MSGGAREGERGSIIDLHVHTRRHSLDSGLDPESLARRCLDLGLAAVCITEHNHLWSRREARELSERFRIPILRGMEVATEVGHVLVFGVEGYQPEMYSIERLRAITEAEGGAMVLAHPWRDPGFRRPWSEARDLFEAVEGLNGEESPNVSAYVRSMAQSVGLPVTGGSDAHTASAVGRVATLFPTGVREERQLVQGLQTGDVRALCLASEGFTEGCA